MDANGKGWVVVVDGDCFVALYVVYMMSEYSRRGKFSGIMTQLTVEETEYALCFIRGICEQSELRCSGVCVDKYYIMVDTGFVDGDGGQVCDVVRD